MKAVWSPPTWFCVWWAAGRSPAPAVPWGTLGSAWPAGIKTSSWWTTGRDNGFSLCKDWSATSSLIFKPQTLVIATLWGGGGFSFLCVILYLFLFLVLYLNFLGVRQKVRESESARKRENCNAALYFLNRLHSYWLFCCECFNSLFFVLFFKKKNIFIYNDMKQIKWKISSSETSRSAQTFRGHLEPPRIWKPNQTE